MIKYYPMLASPGTLDTLRDPAFAFEQKLDGVRCLAHIYPDRIILHSRTGKDMTPSFPDVANSIHPLIELCGAGMVLDGEIICPTQNNASLLGVHAHDFQALQTRLQRKTDLLHAIVSYPATFVVFDVLCYDGQDQTLRPWHERRHLINDLDDLADISISPAIGSDDAEQVFNFAVEHGAEGFVAKRRDSLYYPGTRSKDWLKIKPTNKLVYWVGGVTHGYGRRKNLVGGVALGAASPPDSHSPPSINHLKWVGNCGSGFTDADLQRLTTSYARDRRPSPFIGEQPTNIKAWLPPGVLQVKVSYQELTRDGKLRFPTFEGFV